MSKKIFKYQLETTSIQEIEMPQGSEILCIQTQNGIPCIWALVEQNATVTKRKFLIVATGHSLPKNRNIKYIGTYQLSDGRMVFHCFENL